MKREDLLRLISEDNLWITIPSPLAPSPINQDDRLIESFEEINRFFSEYKKTPESGKWIQEHTLWARLQAIKDDEAKVQYLRAYDIYNLLPESSKKISSISDIFDDDDLGILSDESDIFTLKFVKKNDERELTDYVARRKPCSHFEKYESWFRKCHEDINSWKRVLNIFYSENDIQGKWYFVLNGVLVFVEKIQDEFRDKNGKRDGRLCCIFENGTESTMFLRSLWKAMYQNKNGRVVSEPIEDPIKKLQDITEEDTRAGYIYVAKSLSKEPKIQSIANLYKIWFSSTPVEERIKNAEQEPTYLMSPIHLCMTVECYNMNPQKFEKIIHTFFGKSCINLDVFDKVGKRHTPREWFSVPLEIIEQAIDLIIGDNITQYGYSKEHGNILEKED